MPRRALRRSPRERTRRAQGRRGSVVDIFRVRLADAIEDRSLANLLQQAEASFEAKDFRGAVDHAAEAYRAAATRWRSLRPRRMSASSVRSQLQGKSETQKELEALKATLQAGAILSELEQNGQLVLRYGTAASEGAPDA